MLLGTEQDNARVLEHRWAIIGVVLFMHDPDDCLQSAGHCWPPSRTTPLS